MFLISVKLVRSVKTFNETKTVTYIPYQFATALILVEGERCCDGCEEEFQEWFTGYRLQKLEKKQIKENYDIHEDGGISLCQKMVKKEI